MTCYGFQQLINACYADSFPGGTNYYSTDNQYWLDASGFPNTYWQGPVNISIPLTEGDAPNRALPLPQTGWTTLDHLQFQDFVLYQAATRGKWVSIGTAQWSFTVSGQVLYVHTGPGNTYHNEWRYVSGSSSPTAGQTSPGAPSAAQPAAINSLPDGYSSLTNDPCT